MTDEPAFRPLSKAKRSRFADLATRAGRERHGLFLLEGPKAIEDALARGARLPWLVVAPVAEAAVEAWVAAGRVPDGTVVYRAGEEELGRIADTATPQGVLAVGETPPAALGALPADPGRLVLLADGVQDPGNLGTLLRTLAAVGGKAAICCRGTVDPYNPKALRGAAGATLSLAVAAGISRPQALGWCAERDVPVVALEAGAPDLFEAVLPDGPLALAVGNEAGGLSAELRGKAATRVGLPMSPAVESLSVAVAGSVALYALAHRLTRKEER